MVRDTCLGKWVQNGPGPRYYMLVFVNISFIHDTDRWFLLCETLKLRLRDDDHDGVCACVVQE